MPPKRTNEYKALSRRARALLTRPEGIDVDFKRSPQAVTAEHLVAFANSVAGGAILVGIEDDALPDGRQRGSIVGCDVGDATRLTLMNTATTCVPPISIEIVVENAASLPFLRVEILPSSMRPHSTGGGTYKVRRDGRSAPLLRDELLTMLVEQEGATFASRFRKATERMQSDFERSFAEVQQLAESIHTATQGAESEASDATWSLQQLESDVPDIARQVGRTDARVRDLDLQLQSLLAHTGAPDPIKQRETEKLKKDVARQLDKDEKLRTVVLNGGAVGLNATHSGRLSKEEVEHTLREAVREYVGAKRSEPAKPASSETPPDGTA